MAARLRLAERRLAAHGIDEHFMSLLCPSLLKASVDEVASESVIL